MALLRCLVPAAWVAIALGGAPKEPAMQEVAPQAASWAAQEMLDALREESAKEALGRFAASAKTITGVVAEPGSVGFVKAMMNPMERITKSIRERHGLKKDFEDDLTSLRAAANKNNDFKLNWNLDHIAELLTGKQNARQFGRIPELDGLADGFSGLKKEQQEETVERAREILKEMKVSPSDRIANGYVFAMTEIMEKGPEHFVKQFVILATEGDDKSGVAADVDEKRPLLNVLGMFLTSDDKKTVQVAIRAAKKENEHKKPKEEKKSEL